MHIMGWFIMPKGQITDADLLALINESPLAAEQLRRIVAERERAELEEQLGNLNGQVATSEAEAIIESG
jgi:hypothetical protein